jgi:hypothetical protein
LSEKKSDKNKTGEKTASKTLKVTTDKTRTFTTTQSVDTTCSSFREDCTGRRGWMHLLYLGLKPKAELYELVEFTIKHVVNPKHMSPELQDRYKKIVYASLVPGMLDTVTTTRYATDTISALDFDRVTTNDRLLQDRLSSKGGLKSLLIERGVEGQL